MSLLPAVVDKDDWLERFDAARAELAQIETVEGAARFRAYATTLATAARSLKIGKDGVRSAEFLVLEAERRLGELLAPSKYQPGILRDAGVTANESSRAQQVAAVPNEVFEDFRATTRTPKRERLLRVAREAKAAERRAEPSEPSTRTDDIEIRHGDLRTALDDLAGTVDAIITDPPYPAEFLGEFDALGDLAARLLAPCGVLVAMVGQSHLPEYMARLGAHLTYRWTAAYMVDGPAARIHQRMVGTKWKPLLVYDRGAERSFIAQDVFRSSADDKEHHGWGQSESGMSDIVSRLTFPGSLVVDPFLGGGTTALVCRDLGRRFVGCDIDADAVATTRERLA